MAVEAVESDHFPYLPVTLTVGERTDQAAVLLDTGFDGDVAVPPDAIMDDRPPDEYRIWGLADGSVVATPIYHAAG